MNHKEQLDLMINQLSARIIAQETVLQLMLHKLFATQSRPTALIADMKGDALAQLERIEAVTKDIQDTKRLRHLAAIEIEAFFAPLEEVYGIEMNTGQKAN